jgi:hypothetical protein
VQDAELGFKMAPDNESLLAVYWWALDELGHTKDALASARRLHDKIPDHLFLAYHMGYLAGKLGQPASAIQLYEEELRHRPDNHLAMENLTLLRLMEGNTAAASDLMLKWMALAPEHMNTEDINGKMAKFKRLENFVDGNSKGFSLALDVIRLNEQSEPFLGAELKVPEEKPTREQFIQLLMGADAHRQQELTYAFQMEQRGDYSIWLSCLEKECPVIGRLPFPAIRSIVEGQAQLDETTRADFAPSCVAFCKALEIALFTMAFQAFRQHIQTSPAVVDLLAQAANPDFEKASAFTKFISKGVPLELGTMAMLLNFCRGNTGKNMKLLGAFRDWLDANGFAVLVQPGIADQIGSFAKTYRNPATHSENYNRETGLEVRRVCLGLMNQIFPQLSHVEGEFQ